MKKTSIAQLQGTPFIIEPLHLKDGEKRRHQSRCIYFISANKFCTYRSTKCPGSSHCKPYKEGSKIADQNNSFYFFDKTKSEDVSVYIGNKVTHDKHGVGVIKDIRPAINKSAPELVVEIKFDNKNSTLSFRVPESFENQILKLKKSVNRKRKTQQKLKPTTIVNFSPAPMIEKVTQPKKKRRRKKKKAKKTFI